jgi:hypothetical protein
MGQIILLLADRLSSSTFETGSAVVALSRELDRLLAEALKSAEQPDDPIRELELRRRLKAAQAGN